MSLRRALRRRLGLKFFLSYLVVIIVGVGVLASAAELTVPTSFGRHLASMESMMDGMRPGEEDLFSGYRAAVAESLDLGGGGGDRGGGRGQPVRQSPRG